MALRGSLAEFKLPDIFQLIANDGKTGQLVLYNKDSEAFVIFFRGSIVSAGCGALNLQTILFRFLIDIKHYSEEELNELLYLCQGEMKLFTHELAQKGYLSKDEIFTISRMSIEDIVCGLFLWEDGRYRFDSLNVIDDYTAGGVSLSADAVTMEAMRRIDEWKRMRGVLSGDTVLVHIIQDEIAPLSRTTPNPIMDPMGFLLSRIDGVSSISTLCRTLFFTEYRIYEAIFTLVNSHKITPLESAPIPQQNMSSMSLTSRRSVFGRTPAAFVIAHCLIAVLWGSGFLIHNYIFSKKNLEGLVAARALSASCAENRIRVAALYFHSVTGALPSGIDHLRDCGLITAKDVSNYPSRVQNSLNQTQDSLEKK